MADDTAPPAPAPGAGASGTDIAASLRASRELGPDYDAAIAAAIVERLDEAVDERVGRRLAEAGIDPANPRPAARNEPNWTPRMTMGLLAMCFLIPLTAICGSFMGATGVVLAMVGTTLFYLISIIGTRR
ncbi:hypothetical protein [Streptomonospora wellingtoniae]|uniref:DUF1707 domain-containing protein n=1 Tax=Streptomonospora wellingtoniae TaxID=3075544 RepID=A0ABU2KX65_9ACTN|nr:hypothetical protein [Streptomonospora sp. DSM 45055]MDT0303906.1 hypothetical protein [Streptomonospora sp. DSM 45055]